MRELRRVPLVQDHDVQIAEEFCPVGVRGVGLDIEIGVGGREVVEGLRAEGIGAEVCDGPVGFGLEGDDVVSQISESAQKTTEEVGVAVVPVGPQRMGEVPDAKFTGHGRSPREVGRRREAGFARRGDGRVPGRLRSCASE